jgi:hypothetical protein
MRVSKADCASSATRSIDGCRNFRGRGVRVFSYRLSTQSFAAVEIARWSLKPIPASRYQPKPPRLICFYARTEAGRPRSYQLTVHRTGKKAHIDAPDISADFTPHQLTGFLTDVLTKWADSHGA